MAAPPPPVCRQLGLQPYTQVWQRMQEFTDTRSPDTRDEFWFLEHPRVYTQGVKGKPEHILDAGDIPIVQIDRGGQVTYHGPGQLVVYTLLDLRRLGIGPRGLVRRLEQAIMACLAGYGIAAHAREGAPGVFVDERKIASLGLRVRRGCSFHGLALNVDLDLEPFTRINPCGYRGLEMTRLADQGVSASLKQVARTLAPCLLRAFDYTENTETALNTGNGP